MRRRIADWRAEGAFRVLSQVMPRNPGRVLNFGAGDCVLSELLADRLGAEIENVDVEDTNLSRMPLRIYDGQKLPFESGSFDWVISLYVFHHIPDQEQAMREVSRVARGRVVLVEDRRERSIDELRLRALHAYLARVVGENFSVQSYRSKQGWIELAGTEGLCLASEADGPSRPGLFHPGSWALHFEKGARTP